ncbi:long-chain-fatty-acid CoA ligase, putative [Entamoeba invadens IP1]|uniref:Long-chain-fatty-acid CoA ligase, putative n=1 Tax=Entamoeba invadens IP1 TaxID=370355 RepID=A0A0A1U6Z1_ENTIV|nr:long-chain-fatty-acid CoA ligase, putative [Entamoeba invadens IP1]ELP88690.1 long-chain-fatty-acid CoA ligase, putative [Entamoeba invadens IP1]|eukprot:XP_004255461.1 long-chain-fatty-acid CoA ligase, putative [Entamoeba invadens IP1]
MNVAKFRALNVLANRCKYVGIGGGKSSNEIKDFLFDIGMLVSDGYGTSETGNIAELQSGQVKDGADLKLIDCPEMGYTTQDNPPRGEIVAHTNEMSDGYYHDEEKTNEAFVTIEGKKYFKTGDIGMIKDGKVSIIDRKAFSIKTSQGIFIMPSTIEQFVLQIKEVKQAFVFGDINVSFICAVVVVDRDVETKNLLTKIQHHMEEKKLHPSEIPQKLVITHKEFTSLNGFLLVIGKMNRAELTKHYKHYIFEPERTIIEGTTQEEECESDSYTISKELETILRLFVPSLKNVKNIKQVTKQSLANLGADSVTIGQITNSVNKTFGLKLKIREVFAVPSIYYLHLITQGISTVITDVNWEEEVTKATPHEVFIKKAEKNTIMITGASGFVGRFVLRSVCEKTERRIVCLVRSQSKLVKVFQEACGSEDLFNRLFKKIEVVEGDQTAPLFNLKEEKYNSLLEEVNVVINTCGRAHMYESYQHLYDVNVKSVTTILSFCQKNHSSLIHISSTSVLQNFKSEETVTLPSNYLNESFGYGQSKWVGEQIIARTEGVTRTIVRLGLAGFDRVSGINNEQDLLAPIYREIVEKKVVCFDWNVYFSTEVAIIPIDFVADSIVLILEKIEKEDGSVSVYHADCECLTPLKILFDGKGFKTVNVETMRETVASLRQFTDQCRKVPKYKELVKELPKYTSKDGDTLINRIEKELKESKSKEN